MLSTSPQWRPRNARSGVPLARGKIYFSGRSLTEDAMTEIKVELAFPNLISNPKAEDRRRPRCEAIFLTECCKALRKLPRFSKLPRSRKELYRKLVVGSASNPLEEIRSQWNWMPGLGFLNNSEFSVTWWLVQNAIPLSDWAFKAGLANLPDCPRCISKVEKTASTTACGSTRFGVTSGSLFCSTWDTS